MFRLSPRSPQQARRAVLAAGVVFLVLGVALHLAPPGPVTVLAPWLELAGGLLVLLYLVVNKAAHAPAERKAESMLFDPSTQMPEAPRDDDAPR